MRLASRLHRQIRGVFAFSDFVGRHNLGITYEYQRARLAQSSVRYLYSAISTSEDGYRSKVIRSPSSAPRVVGLKSVNPYENYRIEYFKQHNSIVR